MNLLRSKPLQRYLPPAALFLSLLALYLLTLAPGLTWAHDGSDGGDLIVATATGGIPHPTGYPLYLLLARLFQLLPFGSLAYRTNLMSAFCMALAAVLVYGLASRSTARGAGTLAWPQGLAAGYAFGLAPLAWSQALITEVYALQAFLVVAILHLYTTPRPVFPESQARLDCWRGLLLGLAMGNHLTTLLLAPAALLLGSLRWKTRAGRHPVAARRWPVPLSLDRSALLRQLAWFAMGLCLYAILLLRALSGSPVNWGNPVTPARFWWLVSGQLYWDNFLPGGLVAFAERVRAWAALLLEQFGLPGLVLGVSGLVLFRPAERASRLSLLTAWTAFVFSLFAILYHPGDSYVYLIPFLISFALWIGMGVSGLASVLPGQLARWGPAVGVLMAAYFLGSAAIRFPQLDASRDTRAEGFARAVLREAPEDALVFASGDRAVFALWYFHYALEERPDVTVIASELLHFDWYLESLRATYPSLALPGPLPYPQTIVLANPARAACDAQYTDRAEIACTRPADSP